MGYQENINQSKGKSYEKLIATKILDLIDELRFSSNEKDKRRWIWELLQNAKDVKSYERGSVDIVVDLNTNDEVLIFKHNGKCFSSDNITFLIEQISTKDRSDENLEETTGKFGTGFLTTHLLSEIVEVEGIVKDDGLPYRKFCITLDRSGTDIEEIIASVNQSLKQLEQLDYAEDYEGYDESNFNTVFTYYLDENGLNTAQIGIQDLENSLPLTLVFLPSISSVTIQSQNIIYHVTDNQELDDFKNCHFRLCKVGINNSKENRTLTFITTKDSHCEIAIPVVQKDSRIFIADLRNNTIPRIFCDFPLVGSEEFGIPFFINSSYFYPTEPRDGIYLTDKENDRIKVNKQIVEKAVYLYLELIDYAVFENWENLYQFANISIPNDMDWLSKAWYQENILSPIQEKIYTTPLVKTESGFKVAIKEEDVIVSIPFDTNEEVREAIWNLVEEIGFRIPAKAELHKWYEIFKNEIWDRKHRLTISALSEEIQDHENLEDFSENFELENPIEWLNQYFYVLSLAKEDPLEFLQDEEYSIIPNQYGEFCLPDSLQNDDGIEDALKDVGGFLSKDYYKILAHKSITFSHRLHKKTQANVIREINHALQSEKISQDQKRGACNTLTKLFPYNDDDFLQLEQRDIIYDVSKNLFSDEILEKEIIHQWSPEIWEVSDRMQAKCIVEEISEFNDLHTLSNDLSEEIDHTREWLSTFVNLLVKLEWTDLLGEKTPILPNQNGTFCDLNSLFCEGEPVDESLKDIASSLRRDFRDDLIDNKFEVPIPKTRRIFQKDIGSEIRDLTSNRLQEVERSEETQEIFNKLILWMDDNPYVAQEIFGDLFENRHKLYDDDEVAENLRKVRVLEEENQSLKSENEELKNEIKQLKSQIPKQVPDSQDTKEGLTEDKQEIDDDFLITYGVTTPEKLEKILSDPEISRRYSYSSASEYFSRLEYVLEIINRAKENVKKYLESLEDYDCSGWDERGETYIVGVLKRNEPIKIIVRPSDNRKVIFYYPEEKQVLSGINSELWVEDGRRTPRQITLGVVLEIQGIDQIDLPESF
ncbi:MAG: sacsin N-terminal ATP-binding-like domain-containing protein [Halothece sp.]